MNGCCSQYLATDAWYAVPTNTSALLEDILSVNMSGVNSCTCVQSALSMDLLSSLIVPASSSTATEGLAQPDSPPSSFDNSKQSAFTHNSSPLLQTNFPCSCKAATCSDRSGGPQVSAVLPMTLSTCQTAFSSNSSMLSSSPLSSTAAATPHHQLASALQCPPAPLRPRPPIMLVPARELKCHLRPLAV